MKKSRGLKLVLASSASMMALASGASADEFNIPGGSLNTALNAYGKQTGIQLIYSDVAVKNVHTRGVTGDLSVASALSRILAGTGFASHYEADGIVVGRDTAPRTPTRLTEVAPIRVAAVSAGVESVVVTSSKIKGDIQTVPIAITALSQEQLTSRQIAGGPDLVKEVPNLTFSKTNFTGYNIQIRGIGTQAISVTTDPAVAVAFNDIPFIRNHFFEQEFYDLSQAEVLRGPQGTLYGRNATAGVINIVSAKPSDQFEAMMSADWGNFHNRRYEAMINVPVVDDRFDVRFAAEWTKRDGYSTNELTGNPIDGRNLWSSRLTLGVRPTANLQAYLVWEHFQESDDRIRSSKQLCKTDNGPAFIDGVPTGLDTSVGVGALTGAGYLTQSCLPESLYSSKSFEVPNGNSLPYVLALKNVGLMFGNLNPYFSATQSTDLRVIESTIDPHYTAKNDIVELNTDYTISPELTLTSQTGYNQDFLYSTEDYNRFNTRPGVFASTGSAPGGVFCDPQLGCSSRLVAEDLSVEHGWQFSQEFRLTSNNSGPMNFSLGANYLHYQTAEDYYVFINALTLFSARGTPNWTPGVSDNSQCLSGGLDFPNLSVSHQALKCSYIDPNPIGSLNGNGHNYFRSSNPYTLDSYAWFGEVNYDIASDLKLVGGLRWTDDSKHFIDVPSEVLVEDWGYPNFGSVDQEWNETTGRLVANWTPKLNFTDQTLVYGSYAHGYKAGGANPPGAVLLTYNNPNSEINNPVHPLTFAPEFIDAFELGSKNTLLDGALTLNGDVFYYDYKGYQISRIVDRTSINDNFDAHIKGAELEAMWEPLPGFKLNFAGGYEDTSVAKGSRSIDLIDRTAGNSDWVVIKPFITQASNCIIPSYVIAYMLQATSYSIGVACGFAYNIGDDPATVRPYVLNPAINAHNDPITPGTYAGFDPRTAPNNGEGFYKDLSNNELPNAPHFTTSLSAEYTIPVSEDWAATLHSDFYWQSQSWARIFNDVPYDKLRGYSNVNLALILTSASGWQVLGYLKNVFDKTAITGDFLNSDDSGLTTNVFLTDPRLFGVRVTKNW